MISVRQADTSDLEQLKNLWRESFDDTDEYINWYYENVFPNNVVFVAEIADEIIGMLHLNPYEVVTAETSEKAYYIVGVATKRGHRKKGIMKLLMSSAFGFMKKSGCTFTYLMPANVRYYQGLGFVKLEESWWMKYSNKVVKKSVDDRYKLVAIADVTENQWMEFNKNLSGRYSAFIKRDGAYMTDLDKQCQVFNGNAVAVMNVETDAISATYGTMVTGDVTEVVQYISTWGNLAPLLATMNTGFTLELFGETPDSGQTNLVTGEGRGIMFKDLSGAPAEFTKKFTSACICEIV